MDKRQLVSSHYFWVNKRMRDSYFEPSTFLAAIRSIPPLLRLPREIQHQIFTKVMELDLDDFPDEIPPSPFQTTRIHHISKSLTPLCASIRYSTVHLHFTSLNALMTRLILDSKSSSIFRPRIEALSRLSISLLDSACPVATLALAHFEHLTHLSLDTDGVSTGLLKTLLLAVGTLEKLKILRLVSMEALSVSDSACIISSVFPTLEQLYVNANIASSLFSLHHPKLELLSIEIDDKIEIGCIPWKTVRQLRLGTRTLVVRDLLDELEASVASYEVSMSFLPLRSLTGSIHFVLSLINKHRQS
jgi:hypothetical protein